MRAGRLPFAWSSVDRERDGMGNLSMKRAVKLWVPTKRGRGGEKRRVMIDKIGKNRYTVQGKKRAHGVRRRPHPCGL